MRFFVGLGLLFLAGVICNCILTRPIPWDNIIAGSTIAGCLILAGFWVRRSNRKMEEIIQWSIAHAQELDDKGRYFRDSPWPDKLITRETKVRSFQMTTSMIFCTHRISLGYALDWGFLRGAFATCWTLLFGWWALPWGPGHTIASILENIRGGDAVALKDLPASAQVLRVRVGR
ncbi:MAG: hypothetical protein ACI9NC_001246 [Verrucomicrobiales bacterium]|jgi:hypothetical protein